jgi:hypothetical protein
MHFLGWGINFPLPISHFQIYFLPLFVLLDSNPSCPFHRFLLHVIGFSIIDRESLVFSHVIISFGHIRCVNKCLHKAVFSALINCSPPSIFWVKNLNVMSYVLLFFSATWI